MLKEIKITSAVVYIFLFAFIKVQADTAFIVSLDKKPLNDVEEINLPLNKKSFISKKLNQERAEIEKEKQNFVWRVHEGKVLPENEKLVFDVNWQFISVGEATLELRGFEEINARKAYHIYSEAKTKPFFDNFFKVRDVNESWIDAESMSSLKFVSNVSEGDFKKYEEIQFDQIRKTYYLYDRGKIQMGDIPQYVQDVFTSLYYVRTMDIKTDGEYVFDVHTGDETWPLVVKVLRKDTIKINKKKIKCFVVEPQVRENAGIFHAKGKIEVWLTDDDKKKPIYMKSKIPIGSIKAILKNF
jgi:hypothetical protein